MKEYPMSKKYEPPQVTSEKIFREASIKCDFGPPFNVDVVPECEKVIVEWCGPAMYVLCVPPPLTKDS